MSEKNIKTRIIHKHDVEANWLKATTFIPKQGELIVYDKDSTHSYERFKIGDGETAVTNLPFTLDVMLAEAKESGEFDGEDGYTPVRGTDYWTDADKAEIKAYVDDAILNGAW